MLSPTELVLTPPATIAEPHPMSSTPPTIVIVPGHGNSGPEHWQTLLERAHPGAIRVQQKHWNAPIRRQWVAGLERTMRALDGRAILVGHSAGVSTIVAWAHRAPHVANIAGAILVAPPDMDTRLPGYPPRWAFRLAGWAPVPMHRLPFHSIVVASENDHFCAPARARAFAHAWGSEFVDIGRAGHINTAAGFGEWPLIHQMVDRLSA